MDAYGKSLGFISSRRQLTTVVFFFPVSEGFFFLNLIWPCKVKLHLHPLVRVFKKSMSDILGSFDGTSPWSNPQDLVAGANLVVFLVSWWENRHGAVGQFSQWPLANSDFRINSFCKWDDFWDERIPLRIADIRYIRIDEAFGTSFSFCHRVSYAVSTGAACPIFMPAPSLFF